MAAFKKMFGLSESEVKTNCIICPANDSSLFTNAGKRFQGLIFSGTNTGRATVISIKNNFLAGDCVLSLEDTPCENIFLFGSCASTGQIPVGSIHIAEKSFSLESFSQMLEKTLPSRAYFPDKALFDRFLEYSEENELSISRFASAGSIMLEKDCLSWFSQNGVSCVDMESSIIFSAAAHIKRKALALSYVTDVIGKKPFYDRLSAEDGKKVASARKTLSRLFEAFIENGLS